MILEEIRTPDNSFICWQLQFDTGKGEVQVFNEDGTPYISHFNRNITKRTYWRRVSRMCLKSL